MADSFSKKENFKKKQQKLKEKALRREDRKTNNDKGKSLDEMFMYVDEFGQLTSTPPNKDGANDISLDDIQLGAARIEQEDPIKIGIVSFLSDKGYGFITENGEKDNVFFHTNNCLEIIKKGHKVSFEKERSPKGFSAINIKIVR